MKTIEGDKGAQGDEGVEGAEWAEGLRGLRGLRLLMGLRGLKGLRWMRGLLYIYCHMVRKNTMGIGYMLLWGFRAKSGVDGLDVWSG